MRWAAFAPSLLRQVTLVLLGFAVPLAVFLVPYVASHSVHALYRGVFVTTRMRMSATAFPPPWWRVAVKFGAPALLLWIGVPRAR